MTDALDVDTHIGGVVRMQRIVHSRLYSSERMPRAREAPSCACTPAVALYRTILERAVLHKFGKDTAVCSVADVLKEDAEQFVANLFAALWRFHRLCSIYVNNGSQQ